jgi:hypothetical protein
MRATPSLLIIISDDADKRVKRFSPPLSVDALDCPVSSSASICSIVRTFIFEAFGRLSRMALCVKEGGGAEGECERERALGLLLCHSPGH